MPVSGTTGVRRRPQHIQRSINRSRVMSALRDGPSSRSELAGRLGLDRSTLTHLAGDLLRAELVVETEEGSPGPRGGRRPRLLQLNPARYSVLGCDIRADRAPWVLMSLDGAVTSAGEVRRASRAMPGASSAESSTDRPNAWLRAAARRVRDDAERATRGAPPRILAAGISVPGLVDAERGTLIRSVELESTGVDIASHWRGVAGAVLVDNDANCSAWNLARTSPDVRNAVLVQVKVHRDRSGAFQPSGAGIGMALVVDGRLYYGSRHASGELRGVGWSSGSPDQLGLRLDRIQQSQGEEAALRALAREVLRNLSVVVSVMDPDVAIIAGDLCRSPGLVDDLLRKELAGTSISALAGAGGLRVAGPGELPAAEGAASMALARVFAQPDSNGAHGAETAWDAVIRPAASLRVGEHE